MDRLDGKTVLIGQSQFEKFGGSEIITLELAEHFAARGARVLIAVRIQGEPLLAELAGHDSIDVFDVDDPALDRTLRGADIHLAWIHHHVIPAAILDRPDVPVVFLHMSAIHPLEFPLMASLEAAIASRVLFVSPETRRKHRENGWTASLSDGVDGLFRNPAPDSYFDAPPVIAPSRPRLLVVSNHLPDELIEALDSVSDTFDVVKVGHQVRHGGTPTRVTPQLVASSHAVLSIGKTVQYALASGRPVYCYDHFGGPGWLTLENFEEVGRRNFSGRGNASKAAADIVDELRNGFAGALDIAPDLQAVARTTFSLSESIARIEESLTRASGDRESASSSLKNEHTLAQKIVDHLTRSSARYRRAHEKVRASLTHTNASASSTDAALRAAQDACARAESELARTREELAAVKSRATELADLERRLRQDRQRLLTAVERESLRASAAESALDALTASASWRVTRPLRWVRTRLRGG